MVLQLRYYIYRCLKYFSSLVVIVAWSHYSLAFAPQAHVTIFDIAMRQLSVDKQNFINDEIILPYLKASNQGVLNPLAVAILPDANTLRSFTSSYHFAANRIYNPQRLDLTQYSRREENILFAVESLLALFTDQPMNDLEAVTRFTAFVMLVHLVGDAHQPLHAIQPFYKIYQTESDIFGDTLGGNKIRIQYQLNDETQRTNLHQFSDSVPILFRGGRKTALDISALTSKWEGKPRTDINFFRFAGEYADQYVTRFSDYLLDQYKCFSTEQITDRQPEEWLDESQAIAENVLMQLDSSIFKLNSPTDYITLHPSLVDDFSIALEQRIVLAGLRLGYILDQIIPDQVPSNSVMVTREED